MIQLAKPNALALFNKSAATQTDQSHILIHRCMENILVIFRAGLILI